MAQRESAALKQLLESTLGVKSKRVKQIEPGLRGFTSARRSGQQGTGSRVVAIDSGRESGLTAPTIDKRSREEIRKLLDVSERLDVDMMRRLQSLRARGS